MRSESDIWRSHYRSPIDNDWQLGLVVLSAGHFRTAHHRVPERTLTDLVLFHCIDGHGHMQIAQERYNIGTGDIMLLPAHIPHCCRSDRRDGWEIYWVHANGYYANNLIELMGLTAQQPIRHIGVHNELIACFERLLPDETGKDNASAALALADVLFAAIRICQMPHRDLIHRVQAAAEQATGLDDLAAAVGCSKYHLVHRFKATTGQTPWHFALRIKINKAKSLLADPQYRVADVAMATGFGDANYFSQVFRRFEGCSPSAYRRSIHGPDTTTAP